MSYYEPITSVIDIELRDGRTFRKVKVIRQSNNATIRREFLKCSKLGEVSEISIRSLRNFCREERIYAQSTR